MTEKKFEPLRVKDDGPRPGGEARTIWKGAGKLCLIYRNGDRDEGKRLGRQGEQSGCGVEGF